MTPHLAKRLETERRFALYVALRNLRIAHTCCIKRARVTIYWRNDRGAAAWELAEAAKLRAQIPEAKRAAKATPYWPQAEYIAAS